MKKILFAAAVLCALSGYARAQTSTAFLPNTSISAAQVNAAFASKQDYKPGVTGTVILQDVYANIPFAATANSGAIFLATDTHMLYRDNGSVWQLVTNVLAGTAANIPAAGIAGRLFVATDTGAISYDTGAGWVTTSAGGGISTLTVTGDVTGTSVGGSITLHLANANANVGTCGSASNIPILNADVAGRVLSCSTTPISIAATAVSGLGPLATQSAANTPVAAVSGGLLTAATVQGNTSRVQMAGTGTPVSGDCAKFDANSNLIDGGGCLAITQSTLASRPAPGTSGRLYYTTDTSQLFRDSGTAWQIVTDTQIGLAANRPAAGTVNRYYFSSDTNTLSIDTGSTWLNASSSFTLPVGATVLGSNSGGSPIAAATQGNTTTVQLAGTVKAGNCATFDANLNTATISTPCVNYGSGTLANRLGAGITGRLYFATDTQALYEDTGSAWELATNATAGLGATIPAAGVAGRLYVATDLGTISFDNGSTWQTVGIYISQGLASARPSAGTQGRLYYATDAQQLFRDTGAAWSLVTNVSTGTAAARPAAGVFGRFYLGTDTGALSFDTGSAWIAISSGATLTAPSNATVLSSNSAGALVASPIRGSGLTVQMAGTGTPVAGNCTKFGTDLGTVDAGGFCMPLAVGTLSARPAASTANNFYFASDVGQLYRDSGTFWTLISNTTTGLASARPAASTSGRFFLATDTAALSYDTGTSWISVAGGSASSTLATVSYGLSTALPAVGHPGNVYVESDSLAILVDNGASWITVASSVASGTAAAIPTVGTLGRFYIATDTHVAYYDTGATWIALNGTAANSLVNNWAFNLTAGAVSILPSNSAFVAAPPPSFATNSLRPASQGWTNANFTRLAGTTILFSSSPSTSLPTCPASTICYNMAFDTNVWYVNSNGTWVIQSLPASAILNVLTPSQTPLAGTTSAARGTLWADPNSFGVDGTGKLTLNNPLNVSTCTLLYSTSPGTLGCVTIDSSLSMSAGHVLSVPSASGSTTISASATFASQPPVSTSKTSLVPASEGWVNGAFVGMSSTNPILMSTSLSTALPTCPSGDQCLNYATDNAQWYTYDLRSGSATVNTWVQIQLSAAQVVGILAQANLPIGGTTTSTRGTFYMDPSLFTVGADGKVTVPTAITIPTCPILAGVAGTGLQCAQALDESNPTTPEVLVSTSATWRRYFLTVATTVQLPAIAAGIPWFTVYVSSASTATLTLQDSSGALVKSLTAGQSCNAHAAVFSNIWECWP